MDELLDLSRQEMSTWLSDKNYSLDQLVNWMQGHGLSYLYSAMAHGAACYQPPSDSLVMSTDDEFKPEFARRVAEFLEKKLYKNVAGSKSEEVVYNILALSSALKKPLLLAESLYHLFE